MLHPELGPLLQTHLLSREAPWVWEDAMSLTLALPQHSGKTVILGSALEVSYIGMLIASIVQLLAPSIP